MTSYSIHVMHCPDCNCKFVFRSLSSYSTFDAICYTDGSVHGSPSSSGGLVLSCPKCAHCHWATELAEEQTYSVTEYDKIEALEPLPAVFEIEHDQYPRLLREKFWHNAEQEKYIRTHAWWEFNMPYRDYCMDSSTIASFELPEEQAENLRNLLPLLDSDENGTIMKAEVLRELGEFDACIELLDHPFGKGHLPAVSAIRKLASRNNPLVALIYFPNDDCWSDFE